MGVSVDIQGAEAIATGIGKVLTQTERKVNVAVQKAAIDTMSDAKNVVPVDTGALRDSIVVENGDLEASVGTELYYAPFVEFGTRKMRARPFLYPAFERAAKALEDELKDIL